MAADQQIRWSNGEASALKPQSSINGEGGIGCRVGREDAGPNGAAVRRSPDPDHNLAGAVA